MSFINSSLANIPAFVDTTNVISSLVQITSPLTRQVQQDTWLYVQVTESTSVTKGVQVSLSASPNNIRIADLVTKDNQLVSGLFPIKKGQTYVISQDGGGFASSVRYSEFGMQ